MNLLKKLLTLQTFKNTYKHNKTNENNIVISLVKSILSYKTTQTLTSEMEVASYKSIENFVS